MQSGRIKHAGMLMGLLPLLYNFLSAVCFRCPVESPLQPLENTVHIVNCINMIWLYTRNTPAAEPCMYTDMKEVNAVFYSRPVRISGKFFNGGETRH
jgi:hypothetical protein